MRSRIGSSPPHSSRNTSKSTRDGQKTSDLTGSHSHSNQDLETQSSSTSDAFAEEPPQDHLHQAVSYPALPVVNATPTADLNLITDIGMEDPWFTPYSTIGFNWPPTDEEQNFFGIPSGAVSPNSHNVATSSIHNGILNSLGGSEWDLGFLPDLLDENDNVARLPTIDHCSSASELSQRTQFDAYPGLHRDYGTTHPVETVTTTHSLNPGALELSDSSSQMTSAQASLFRALLSLGDPHVNNNPPISHPTFQTSSGTTEPQSQPADPMDLDPGMPDDNEDPERIQTIICGQLVLDRNVESNSLPFALHSYAVWMRRTLFDPSRAASRAKDYIIRHFAESKQSRFRTVLIANIFRSIVTNPTFDLNYLPKLSALRTTIQETLTDAARRQTNPSREIQIRESIHALEQTLELLAASRYEPLYICLQLMREVAPVFRRACPELVNQLVHLPGILMHPNPNMRHYPVMDVYFSIVTGLPTNLQYDTSLRSPVDASVLYIDNHLGLSWLYGQPDRITLILARTNSLFQEFGANINAKIIQEIEQDIRCFKVIFSNSPDPSLLVVRLVVQECWRQVAYIYLYMTLCDANALDVRVRTAQQRLMRLINDTKPTPALDMHLAPCLGIAGVVTQRPTEREAMLLRLRGLPECSRPESCFSSCIRILEEIWRRTDSEGRPAKWVDFRLATLRVLGTQ